MAKPCEVCETKPRAKLAKRRRCPECRKLVHECCWHIAMGKCRACHPTPTTAGEWLDRIETYRIAMDEAFDRYEVDCLALWDGDEESVPRRDPTPYQAFRVWRETIFEAADALGVPEELLRVPEEPWQDFPTAPEEGDEDEENTYDISALEVGARLVVHGGGKR